MSSFLDELPSVNGHTRPVACLSGCELHVNADPEVQRLPAEKCSAG
jgi:hypothetical protein